MDDRLDVRELGAKGDDRADDNAAIQAALDRVAGTGGTVFVPPGRHHVGTLLVRSRTTLELAAGATIVQVSNMVARTQGRILITGDAGSTVEDVVLRDVTMSYPYIEDPEPDAEGNTSSQFSNNSRAARRARAAVVAENVKGLGIDGLRVRWPDAEVPADWRIPAKRENGGTRIFRPDYSNPRPCEFSALWGRNLQGGWFRGDADASGPGVRRVDLQGSTIAVE